MKSWEIVDEIADDMRPDHVVFAKKCFDYAEELKVWFDHADAMEIIIALVQEGRI